MSNMFHIKSLTLTNFASAPIQTSLDDLYLCLAPQLKFGQLIGICPYSGMWSRNPDKFPSFRRNSIMVLPSILIMAAMTINVIMNFGGMTRKIMSGQSSPIQIAWALHPPIFYSVALYTYIHFCFHGRDLCSLFVTWRSNCRETQYGREGIKNVARKIRLCAATIMTSAILENVVYHMRHDCAQSNCRHLGEKNFTALEDYYWREHGENWLRVPYHPVVTLILLAVNKLTVIATNYCDITIISMAWAMASKFEHLARQIGSEIEKKRICWSQVRHEFVMIHSLFREMNHFLSPLIFMSYTNLVELISTQLHLGITTDTDRSTMAQIYSAWSFLHLVIRFLLTTIMSSRIMDRCQDILYLLQKCSPQQYNDEVARLERLLAASPVRLSGLGCFEISKPFILSVIHVIFTCEIIFLQSSSKSGKHYKNDPLQ